MKWKFAATKRGGRKEHLEFVQFFLLHVAVQHFFLQVQLAAIHAVRQRLHHVLESERYTLFVKLRLFKFLGILIFESFDFFNFYYFKFAFDFVALHFPFLFKLFLNVWLFLNEINILIFIFLKLFIFEFFTEGLSFSFFNDLTFQSLFLLICIFSILS